RTECHQLSDGTYSDPVCVGSSYPQPEQCPYDPLTGKRDNSAAGIDFACDGTTKDLVLYPGEIGNPCEITQEGVCKQSTYE
ncbi:hypothetical protein, partial [Escherichia coli]|uniref:hypothetical protein n=1 Tax=Escherichia coli TaxID=562 RepID=UPI001BDD7279